jgi:hypothetical protein
VSNRPQETSRELVAGLVQEIEADAAAERKRTGREPLGAAAILRQHPHTCPDKTKSRRRRGSTRRPT